MDAEEKKAKCDARCRAGKCGRSELDCLWCEYMYNEHELKASTIREAVEAAKEVD